MRIVISNQYKQAIHDKSTWMTQSDKQRLTIYTQMQRQRQRQHQRQE